MKYVFAYKIFVSWEWCVYNLSIKVNPSCYWLLFSEYKHSAPLLALRSRNRGYLISELFNQYFKKPSKIRNSCVMLMPINIRQKRPFLWRIQTRLKNFQTWLRTRTTQIKIAMSYMTSVAAAATTIRNGVVYTATGGTGRSKCLENKCTALNLKQHSVPNIFCELMFIVFLQGLMFWIALPRLF